MTAVVPVVREFYANAFFEQDDDLAIVRGTMVSFSVDTINEYYGLETSVNDEYTEYLAKYLDYNAIIHKFVYRRQNGLRGQTTGVLLNPSKRMP